MRNTYLEELYQIAQKDKNVLSLVADNGMIVYDDFRADMPQQFFNFGISEGHMVSAAAGMALCGKIPFLYTISSFLAYRAYEFIRVDVCLQKANVKIVGIGTGVSYGYLGPTHHTTEDIGLLRSLPNLTIFSPGSDYEAREAVRAAYEIQGPVYIRLGNGSVPETEEEKNPFQVGKGRVVADGRDLTVITTGSILREVKKAAVLLEQDGISTQVISMHTLKPFDEEVVAAAVRQTGKIITVEEHNCIGGLGDAVAGVIAERGLRTEFRKIGLNDCFAKGYGNEDEVRQQNGLDGESIYHKIKGKR
ncbi:MAG: transketolase C-terminal domain-containing protein [Lachnospiraceae bacterium]